jgi:hypothetical protein
MKVLDCARGLILHCVAAIKVGDGRRDKHVRGDRHRFYFEFDRAVWYPHRCHAARSVGPVVAEGDRPSVLLQSSDHFIQAVHDHGSHVP